MNRTAFRIGNLSGCLIVALVEADDIHGDDGAREPAATQRRRLGPQESRARRRRESKPSRPRFLVAEDGLRARHEAGEAVAATRY
jgi:hypothetical protein